VPSGSYLFGIDVVHFSINGKSVIVANIKIVLEHFSSFLLLLLQLGPPANSIRSSSSRQGIQLREGGYTGLYL